jgi:aspartate/methionine/tyrosine aminotransferase
MKQTANRAMIDPFEVMEVYREAEALTLQGRHIIHFSLGQPGSAAPLPVLTEVADALSEHSFGYTDARGMPALRTRISEHYRERYNLDIPIHRICVTVGSSAAYFLSLIACFEAGDKIAIARPCYPAYPRMMKSLGIEPVFIDVDEEHRFQPTWEIIKPLIGKVQGLIIASPSNPSGTIIHADELARIAKGCDEAGIRLLSDEIYHHVSYGELTDTALRNSESVITLNSFSKYYLLPGWRLGWAVVPDALARTYENLVQNFFISPPAVSQYAALKVFDHWQILDGEVAKYARNRERLMALLREAGITDFVAPEGAFYIYANISTLAENSKAFCHDMLHEAGVAAVPGNDFDTVRGHNYVRFSFSGTTAAIEEGGARIQAWLASR